MAAAGVSLLLGLGREAAVGKPLVLVGRVVLEFDQAVDGAGVLVAPTDVHDFFDFIVAVLVVLNVLHIARRGVVWCVVSAAECGYDVRKTG